MKGIVAQIKGRYAFVLTQDGSFRKVRTRPYMETGIEIDVDQPSCKVQNARLLMKVTSIAAAALLTLGVGCGAYSYAMPYSYVHLDINPSIELTANVYDKIIKAEALNEDGRKLLNGSNLRYSSIETGVSDLIGLAVEKGYLTESEPQIDNTAPGAAEATNTAGEGANTGVVKQPQEIDNTVLLTVSSNSSKKSENLKKKIIDTASKELDTDKVDSEVLVGEASMEQRNEARELGVTPGKLALIEDAMESEPELQLDDLKKNSVKELLKRIQGKNRQEKGINGNKAGVKEQSSQEQSTDNSSNNPVQSGNTAVLKNQGSGRGLGNSVSAKEQGQIKGNGQAQKAGQSTQDNNKLKNQLRNKTGIQYDSQNGGTEQTNTVAPNNGQYEGTVNNRKEDNGKNKGTNNGKQVKSGVGSGNNKEIDNADLNTAGKAANELKIERKQLRNDLLDQMEKQLEEHSNLSGRKNINADKNNKYGGKSNANSSGKKR